MWRIAVLTDLLLSLVTSLSLFLILKELILKASTLIVHTCKLLMWSRTSRNTKKNTGDSSVILIILHCTYA